MFLTFKFYQRIKIIVIEYQTEGEYLGEINVIGEASRISVNRLI
jgi:hypothetical protein